VMRRRNLRHVYLAAYALVFKYRIEKELKRATFYAQLALQSAEEANESLWKVLALNEMASIYDIDSKFEKAIECGQEAIALLERSNEPRQVRNVHYLLGEVAYKMGDIELAEFHFDKLASFYPDFRHLKSLLFAIDLRSMVNLKL